MQTREERLAYHRAYYQKNKARMDAQAKAWAIAHPEKCKEMSARRNAKNKSYKAAHHQKRKALGLIDKKKCREAMRRYYWRDPAKFRARRASYIKLHPEKNRANVRRYEAAKMSATPSWANGFLIAEIYDLAVRRSKATGIPHEVDHIVPLKSDVVCGLHVEHNLRVIPARLNASKKNKHIFDGNDRRDQCRMC